MVSSKLSGGALDSVTDSLKGGLEVVVDFLFGVGFGEGVEGAWEIEAGCVGGNGSGVGMATGELGWGGARRHCGIGGYGPVVQGSECGVCGRDGFVLLFS